MTARSFWPLLSVLTLCACAVGPDYEKPAALPVVPESYKEAGAFWRAASPADLGPRAPWWERFGDPTLTSLESQALSGNQSLKQSEAALRMSRAALDEANAALFPTLTASGSLTRSGTGSSSHGPGNPLTKYSLAPVASWEPDLWGRLSRSTESASATAQASAADLAAAQLSLAAQTATVYFNLRAQDSLISLLTETVSAYERALAIAKGRYDAGLDARADFASAQAQVESAQTKRIQAQITRAAFEHALAALVGQTPSAFSLPPAPLAAALPPPPAEVPSSLLERRPDIAAAERRMAAANASIGVAQAAFYPDLTLSASYGVAASAASKLFQASNSVWSWGPALAATIFDGGARSARKEQAKAAYDEAVAAYRATTLAAFQEVEDNLAALRLGVDATASAQRAEKSSADAERTAFNQYKAGLVPYTNVIVTQTARLAASETALSARQALFQATLSLTKALGGSGVAPGP